MLYSFYNHSQEERVSRKLIDKPLPGRIATRRTHFVPAVLLYPKHQQRTRYHTTSSTMFWCHFFSAWRVRKRESAKELLVREEHQGQRWDRLGTLGRPAKCQSIHKKSMRHQLLRTSTSIKQKTLFVGQDPGSKSHHKEKKGRGKLVYENDHFHDIGIKK